VPTSVADGHGRAGTEHHQHVLVLIGDSKVTLLVGQVEVVDVASPMKDWRAQEALDRYQGRPDLGKARRRNVGGEVRHPERISLTDVYEDRAPTLVDHRKLRGSDGGEEVPVGFSGV